MAARYVVDEEGRRVGVLLDVEEYERMVEELEDMEDIREARKVQAAIERGEEKTSTLEEALIRIEAEREQLRRQGIV